MLFWLYMAKILVQVFEIFKFFVAKVEFGYFCAILGGKGDEYGNTMLQLQA